MGKGLLLSSGEKWRKRRKLLTPAFHFRILDNFLPVIDEQARVLVEKFEECQGKEWIDIVPFMSDCSFDIVCETIMGIEARAQTIESFNYITSMKTVCETMLQRIFHIWNRYDFIFYLTPKGQEFKQHAKYMDNYVCQIIEERKLALQKIKDEVTTTDPECSERKKRRSFIDVILECYFNDPEFTLEELKHEINTLMIEGHETTAYSASWILYLLGRHRDVQRKVQEEIDEIFGDDVGRRVTGDDLKLMKYTECVIKETMRLYPAVPIIGRTLSEDVDCCGYTLKKGAECIVLIYQVHRDPKVFPDPDCFDPDRFLPENTKGRHTFSYIPFSAGPRNCIGQKFAMMEQKIIIANIMRNFNIESLDPVVKTVLSIILRPLGPIRVRMERRKRDS